jgi:osmoprotectant transport system permease protein
VERIETSLSTCFARKGASGMASWRSALLSKPSAFEPLGGLIAVIIVTGLFAAPFVTYRANRIVAGEGRMLAEALPPTMGGALMILSLAVAAGAAFTRNPWIKLAGGTAGLIVLFVLVGNSAGFVTPAGNSFARVSPSVGFWLLALSFALIVTDALARLRLGPLTRLAFLVFAIGAVLLLLHSGAWDRLSILREYAGRAESFWSEAERHLFLALGSVLAAVCAGLPLGVLCHRAASVRTPILQGLGIVQTIPSIALFGILMVPLGALSAKVPLLAALGIGGIGAAPAFIALFLYALLPVTANTVAGLAQVPATVVDAARGMGLSGRQRLLQVEAPLALPTILAGIRIVLVQNIGLVTVAALIGGGGFGTFVFQGIGQSAIDLVLLGAIPTVALSFAAAVILDALIDLTRARA